MPEITPKRSERNCGDNFHDKAMKLAEVYIAAHGMKIFTGGGFNVR